MGNQVFGLLKLDEGEGFRCGWKGVGDDVGDDSQGIGVVGLSKKGAGGGEVMDGGDAEVGVDEREDFGRER